MGVFVEVNGKYYLSEERLKQMELRSARTSAWLPGKNILALRIAQVILVILFMAFFLVSLLVHGLELKVISLLFLVVWLFVSVLQIYYLSRIRRRTSQTHVSVGVSKSTALPVCEASCNVEQSRALKDKGLSRAHRLTARAL